MSKKNGSPLSHAKEVIYLFSVGPFFLLITLFLLSLKPSDANLVFAPVIVLGYVSSILWRIKGFILSLIILVPVFLICDGMDFERKWLIALSMSFAISFLLLALGTGEGRDKIGFLAEKAQKAGIEKKQSEELFVYKERTLLDKISSLHSTCEQLKKQEGERQELLSRQQRELEEFKNEIEKLKLQLRKEREKIPLASPPPAVQVEEKEIFDLYKQLRVQFDEKNTLLHEVRKELYHVETELAALKKERDEERIVFDSQELRRWSQAIKKEENLKEEVSALEGVITYLTLSR